MEELRERSREQQMWGQMKQEEIDSAREICGCVTVARMNPKSERWNCSREEKRLHRP